jgi:hypothetical protein
MGDGCEDLAQAALFVCVCACVCASVCVRFAYLLMMKSRFNVHRLLLITCDSDGSKVHTVTI